MDKTENNNVKLIQDWTIVQKDGKDYRMKIIETGKATVRIFRPILTEAEAAKREKEIMSAVGRVLSKYDNLNEE